MTDYIQIAKEFVQDQRNRRTDIIAACLYGSVARGEATDSSDIDIAIYINEDKGEGTRNLSCWQNGIFIEAGVTTAKGLSSLDEVMNDPINATHMNDAFILYDPKGFFSDLQKQVRLVYMKPEWLQKRLHWAMNYFRDCYTKLQEAVVAMDPYGVCGNAMIIPHIASSIPLYMKGITPSSTRQLILLKEVDPLLRNTLIEYECSFPEADIDIAAMIETCRSYCVSSNRKDLGGLDDYAVWKTKKTADRGDLREAVDMLWFAMGYGLPTAEYQDKARVHIQDWLCKVGWDSSKTMTGKVRLTEHMQRKLESMIAEFGLEKY
jgi:hypothetical protein